MATAQNYNHPFLAHTYFTPVVDSARGNSSLVPHYPHENVQLGASMPALVGVTRGECAAYIQWLYFVSK